MAECRAAEVVDLSPLSEFAKVGLIEIEEDNILSIPSRIETYVT